MSENDDMSVFQITGYDCISQGKSCSNKGGLLIYIDNKFNSDVKINLNTFQHCEGIIVEISGRGLPNSTILLNLYRPPRSNNEILTEFID